MTIKKIRMLDLVKEERKRLSEAPINDPWQQVFGPDRGPTGTQIHQGSTPQPQPQQTSTAILPPDWNEPSVPMPNLGYDIQDPNAGLNPQGYIDIYSAPHPQAMPPSPEEFAAFNQRAGMQQPRTTPPSLPQNRSGIPQGYIADPDQVRRDIQMQQAVQGTGPQGFDPKYMDVYYAGMGQQMPNFQQQPKPLPQMPPPFATVPDFGLAQQNAQQFVPQGPPDLSSLPDLRFLNPSYDPSMSQRVPGTQPMPQLDQGATGIGVVPQQPQVPQAMPQLPQQQHNMPGQQPVQDDFEIELPKLREIYAELEKGPEMGSIK